MKNLNHSQSLTESCDLYLSNAAILKLWKYLRSTDSPQFFHTFFYVEFPIGEVVFVH
jgi:hypothetical protein